MLRLKANKTSLYKLVNYYVSLPRMRQTQFTKAYRSPDYWLTWTDGWGRCGKAFLSACGGKPLLSITKSELWGEEVSREVHTLELADLRERGMVEKFVRPAPRCHCLTPDEKIPRRAGAPPGADKPRGLP